MKLTNLVKTSGCAAKLNPTDLENTLKKLQTYSDNNLIVGFDNNEDALVYKISDDLVIVESVDFFPPMVDDPYTFGMIAAANSISDIYAMGATPKLAMNVMCFPSCIDLDYMREILQGGIDKAKEAGVTIAGGHTVEDAIPKYGLSVTGFASPNEIWSNASAKEGDVLVITKPIGIGLINTGAKVGQVKDSTKKLAEETMMTLNKYAKEALSGLKVNAVTDVTGFSLAGHSYEMAKGCNCSIEIYSSLLPILPEALNLAKAGIIPEGTYNNKNFLKDSYITKNTLPENMIDVIFDPQTSGGLLISMPELDAQRYVKRMEEFTSYAKIIGKVSKKQDNFIILH